MLKIAFAPLYAHPLPEGHRFPMIKYELIPEQLMYEGTCSTENFFVPSSLVPEKTLLRVHTFAYWQALKNQSLEAKMIRKIGFPLSPQLIERERLIAQGTIECCHFALKYGVSMNVAGGTHHAYADKGEGFCLLNDVAIASQYLLDKKLANKILVIDLDVHQGNGTAVIFQESADVFTFSMHGAENYPLKKEVSDLDIALPTYTHNADYLRILYETLPQLIANHNPDFLFFISGVDVLASDTLGKLSMSIEGCKARDIFVLTQAKKYKIPLVIAMGGGYSPKIRDIVEAHCHTFRAAQYVYF